MPVDVDASVLGVTRLSADYNVVEFDAPAIAEQAQPGQFVMVRPAGGLEPLLRRPFSIFEILRHASGRVSGFSLLNRRVGVTTARLLSAKSGDRFQCLGPLGRPFVAVDPPGEAWMVAGGVGLAPFATLADELARRRTPTTLFYGARTATELMCRDRFEARPCEMVLATEDGSLGHSGRVTEPLARAFERRQHTSELTLYACGPTPMMRAVAELATAHGCRCLVSLEPVMGCGLGGCYSCVVAVDETSTGSHFVRACLEGPVFDAGRIAWSRLAESSHHGSSIAGATSRPNGARSA